MPKCFSIAALSAVIIITVSSALGFAQSPSSRTCKDIFRANGRLTVADVVRADREEVGDKSSYPVFKNRDQKVAYALARLTERGVLVEKVKFRNWYLTKRPALRILPEGEARLNQMAQAMYRNYGVTFYYDPKELGQDDGVNKGLNIFISEHSAFTGQIDLTLLHEIRHVAMSTKEANGQASVTNGFALRLAGRWPWQNSAAGYQRIISMQERATSYQSFIYVLVAGKELLQQLEIPSDEIKKYLLRLQGSAESAREVLESVAAMSVFEKDVYETGGGQAFYSIVNDQVRSFVFKLPMYVHMHVVPRDIFLEYLPPDFEFASNHEKNIFFQMPVGNRLLRDMVVAQLNALEKGALIDLADVTRVLAILKRQKELAAVPKERDFRSLLRAILANKNIPTETPKPVESPAPQPSRPFNTNWELPVTRLLPEEGYSFAGLSSSFAHAQVFTRNQPQEFRDYLALHARDAYYGIVELKLQNKRTGKPTTLRLEWSEASFAELELILNRITLRGYAVTEATVRHASQVAPKWLPNAPALLVYEPILQTLRDIPPDMLTKRNRIRYLRMINSQR